MRFISFIKYYSIAAIGCLVLSSFVYNISYSSESDVNTRIIMTITNIRTSNGIMQIGAFKDNEGFKNEKSTYAFKFNKGDQSEGTLTVSFDMPAGTYGFSLMDDENDNNVMDYNFFGIPKEGFGFGDYYHEGYSKPHFDKFKMELKPGETKEIMVKMRYVL